MSGLEVAGVVLGAFPLLISGIEHWRDIAKIGGFYWQVRKEYTKCLRDIEYHEILFKNNLKELLLPIISDPDQVHDLLAYTGGGRWSDAILQDQLEQRLHGSYSLYQATITEMNEITKSLKKELCFDQQSLQKKLLASSTDQTNVDDASSGGRPGKRVRLSDARVRVQYELFRTKFSLGERTRNELLDQLKECNDRLEKLLSSSDRVSALQSSTPGHERQFSVLETTFKKISRTSDRLFRALQSAWQCSCQQHHFANLRLEHRTGAETCFEMILVSDSPSGASDAAWRRKEILCGNMPNCSASPKKDNTVSRSCHGSHQTSLSVRGAALRKSAEQKKRVNFAPLTATKSKIEVIPLIQRTLQLCQQLGQDDCSECIGMVVHDDEAFHVHQAIRGKPRLGTAPVTLDHILSENFEEHLTRRQRYFIALIVASSVAQLQHTQWWATSPCKEDIIFFPADNETIVGQDTGPFIRQAFKHTHPQSAPRSVATSETSFYSLGIVLLELCFGRRLEDDHVRKKLPTTADATAKHALDVMAALKWSDKVSGEGGDDYAAAVKWCFTGATKENNWRGEFIRNVVRPLEICMEHFQTADLSNRKVGQA